MSDRTKAMIDVAALQHNLALVRRLAPHSRILAMVKGNAYGHGLIPIAKILTGVDGFGVACLDEAIRLREAGITLPVVIMSGVFATEDLHQVSEYDLQIVVHDNFQVDLLTSSHLKQPVTVWLKIDTGMHRLGFLPSDFPRMYEKLANSSQVKKPLILMSHLADADNINKNTTTHQLNEFKRYTSSLPCPKSLANSAGILAWPETIAEWNRPGIMLYGISPLIGKMGKDHGLKPVMTLVSKLIAIHDYQQGDAIGYGGSWSCPEAMRVGVVAIGYGDGYPRHAKNGTPTFVNGKICPLVGRVSMDLITIDLRSCPEAKMGDDVVLWGNGLPAEIVAQYADTIAYELMCNVSQRVVFVYS